MTGDLIVLKGKLYNRAFPLSEGKRLILGRGHDADIQIFEGGLSRHHCAFERINGDVYLCDLNSSNGTCVGGRRIARQKLKDGDLLRFGSVEFQFGATPRTGVLSSSLVAALPMMSVPTLHANFQLAYGAVRAMIATLEAKDDYTRGHSERVTAYAMQIGRALTLSQEALNTLEFAGLLHDIGKIGIPEQILHKPSPLTPEEFAIMRQHPNTGYTILSQIEGSKAVAEAVLHHHERWDGKGYPEGLAGETVSLTGRILAAADSFDAMGSKRPYRSERPKEQVIMEIRRSAGTQLDPQVAEALALEAEAGRINVEKDLAARLTTQEKAVKLT